MVRCIEVITGPMFSGKTSSLIERVKQFRSMGRKCQVFKHDLDNRRSGAGLIQAHDGREIEASGVHHSQEVLKSIHPDTYLIAIDEAQFFDDGLVGLVMQLAFNQDKNILLVGLAQDYLGQPFGIMPKLLAVADKITKLHADCAECGEFASMSYRLTHEPEQIVIGSEGKYIPLCKNCWQRRFDQPLQLAV